MGSSLTNQYDSDTRIVWDFGATVKTFIFGPDAGQLSLSIDGGDASDSVLIYPKQVLSTPYEALVEGLRRRCGPHVYPFAYDWRRSISNAADRLQDLISNLARKPFSVLQGYDGKFDFVCHSMGGLVLRSYLTRWGGAMVNRVVFLGTPHFGSLDAVESMTRGISSFNNGQKEARKLVRTLYSTYELLPHDVRGGTIRRGDTILDVFEIRNWQSNVGKDATSSVPISEERLHAGQDTILNLDLPQKALPPERLLCIVGAQDSSTLKSVQLKDGNRLAHFFDFDHAELGIGDGTVLMTSATLEGGVARVFLDDSFVGSGLLGRFLGLHTRLPLIDEVQTICSRFLSGTDGPGILPVDVDPQRYGVIA